MDAVVKALKVDVERTRERLPAPFGRLADVAWNMAWSWLQDGAAFFRDLDPETWERSGHNARAVLEQGRPFRLEDVALDSAWRNRAAALAQRLDDYLAAPIAPSARELAERHQNRPVAYFSAEFGLHESLPIYSGGLGILAGDHLKSASDLGLGLVGVGLRYRQGYFQQSLDRSGWQTESYHDIDFGSLPTGLLLDSAGQPVTVSVPVQGRTVTLQIWGVQVGRIPLILLDSNRDDNAEIDRWITGHLYGGDRNTRIAQEIVLGIGGVRALRKLGYDPSTFHMNEGHAAFLSLELLRESLHAGENWEDALDETRSKCVFTTHTPVPAGHDVFLAPQVDEFLGGYLRELAPAGQEGVVTEALALGSAPEHPGFNMTHLAIRTSRSTNGVSRLHGEVSREMFHWLWPGLTRKGGIAATPLTHVTNGIHAPTWIAPAYQELFDKYLGREWRTRQADPAIWANVDLIPDQELWDVHCRLKARAIDFVRERARAFREASGEPPSYIEAASHTLDPNALTLGFARRVATYKRVGLLLSDRERSLKLLGNEDRPVQIILAGKAHPGDYEAKAVLQSVFGVRYDPRVQKAAIYVVNYNAEIAHQMVQGVDVWLNVPRRPMEASGTSGMKAALNGALNCSILDGWWAEGFDGQNGWAIGNEESLHDAGAQDRADAESLYSVLENDIVPLYYHRDKDGLPREWIHRMKACLRSLGPVFNTDRMVSEYVRKVYCG